VDITEYLFLQIYFHDVKGAMYISSIMVTPLNSLFYQPAVSTFEAYCTSIVINKASTGLSLRTHGT
jgi:hypothetical protein